VKTRRKFFCNSMRWNHKSMVLCFCNGRKCSKTPI